MSRTIESKRRKDSCKECLIFKPIKCRGMCQNCSHKYKRKNNPNFFLRTRYTEIKQRCISNNKSYSKYYYGKKYCTLKEFLDKFLNDSKFNDLFLEWQKSKWEYKKCPSVDRINNDLDYTIENIQFITHSENATKDQETTEVLVYKNDSFFKEYISQSEAARQLNLPQSNIWKVLNGQRRTAGGYKFAYKKT